MKFVKNIKKTNQTKTKSKDSAVIVVLAILLASVMVASTIAVQEIEAVISNPAKDGKMQRDAQTKLDGGSAFKQQKNGDYIDPKTGYPIAPIVVPPPEPLRPPPSMECINDPKKC
jgi:hypothetical protein